ncbi:HEAT repeat domain-containing protein [Mesoaciditoga sp.]
MEESEKLINRIVDELGNKAIPKLISFLFDSDAKTAELAAEVLKNLESCEEVKDELSKRIQNEEKSVGMFYAADLLADMNCKGSVSVLYRLLDMVEDEKEAIIVYSALLKLGEKEAEKYLLYEFEEDPYMRKSLFDLAIALEPSDNPEVFKAILEKAKEDEELVEVLQSMCNRHPAFFQLLPDDMKDRFRE